jgi:hypothetical protein
MWIVLAGCLLKILGSLTGEPKMLGVQELAVDTA